MKQINWRSLVMCSLISFLLTDLAHSADYPAPKEGSWTVRDFRFQTGETLPELRLNYLTIGDPAGEPVLLLHGTGSAGSNFLNNDFAGELFAPGQPLDAQRYFIVIPDAIGAGKSSKPSDGLRMKFPRYSSDDLVRANYRLLTEHLGVRRLRLLLGSSGGCMQAWIWAITYPDFMETLVPLACTPVELSGRNWMTRRMMIETIRSDPEWNGGNYTKQPHSLQFAQAFFSLTTSGGTRALQKAAPTREKGDQLVNQRLKQPARADANDVIYQYESARDYNPAPMLERVKARVLAINAEDDERNPVELGIMEREIKRVAQGRYILVPASDQTAGHGTTGRAKWWKQYLTEFLRSAEQAAR
jgi:homoserine O-acetyltransferase/O-succinyltransferase